MRRNAKVAADAIEGRLDVPHLVDERRLAVLHAVDGHVEIGQLGFDVRRQLAATSYGHQGRGEQRKQKQQQNGKPPSVPSALPIRFFPGARNRNRRGHGWGAIGNRPVPARRHR